MKREEKLRIQREVSVMLTIAFWTVVIVGVIAGVSVLVDVVRNSADVQYMYGRGVNFSAADNIETYVHPRYLDDGEPNVYVMGNEREREIRGIASFYAHRFHNRMTANGETYDMYDMTVAHRTLPFNTLVRVTNIDNGRSVMARVNDRGPYIDGREIDLSLGVAMELDIVEDGLKRVVIEVVGRVELAMM